MAQVLSGVRVVEQGTFITGPAAGMMLGDLGADVIKVEQPGAGDPFRSFKGGLYSPHFQAYNRNKRSIALDTRDSADRETFDALIRTADIYIHNFRPESAEKIGVGETRLRGLNPRLIYCAISGFGRDGPYGGRPSYDTVAQAASGYLGLLVNPGNPRVVGPAIADAVTGFYAAYGAVGALHERERTGDGRRVDVSMLESMCHFNIDAFTHWFSAGQVMDAYSRPRASQSYVLECADGKWVALHMSSPPKFWDGLAQAIERPDLFKESRFADRAEKIRRHEELIDLLRGIFLQRPRGEWCARLDAHDVPYAPMYRIDEAVEDPQFRHLEIEQSAEHPEMGTFRSVRTPITFGDERRQALRAPPTLDEHRGEILRELGL